MLHYYQSERNEVLKMTHFKRFIPIILASTSIFLLSGCFTKRDLHQPIETYLKTNFGIQDKFSIIDTTNNWFEGIDHETYVEMKKPYRAYPYLMVDREDLKILEDESDDIYIEQFKGAYIEQHPDVVQTMKQIIEKYGLVKYPNKVSLGSKMPIHVFPYANMTVNIKNYQELLDNFKKTQKIDTTKLLPTLIPSDPRSGKYLDSYIGTLNFLFEFDINKNKHEIPKAKDLIKDFQKSGVLTKGVYNIDMLVDDSNPDNFIGWEYNNVALFEVDENGKYTIIATPKYDDLEDAYFYGDYVAKKNKQ